MKILGLDSSGLVASVALVENDVLLAEYTVDYKKTHSQTLLPMLDEIRHMIDLDLDSIDAIAIAAGPGSFTGLRIGAATAKGLGLALHKPLVEVSTLEGLAYQLCGTDRLVCPLMDARRNQVYTGFYQFEKDAASRSGFVFRVVKEQFAADIQDVIGQLNTLGQQVMFLGDGVPAFEQTIREKVKVPYGFAPANCNRQHASALAALAEEYYIQGKMVAADAHKPDYLRLSQAERERLEKENASNS